jgi:hypothetical protein
MLVEAIIQLLDLAVGPRDFVDRPFQVLDAAEKWLLLEEDLALVVPPFLGLARGLEIDAGNGFQGQPRGVLDRELFLIVALALDELLDDGGIARGVGLQEGDRRLADLGILALDHPVKRIEQRIRLRGRGPGGKGRQEGDQEQELSEPHTRVAWALSLRNFPRRPGVQEDLRGKMESAATGFTSFRWTPSCSPGHRVSSDIQSGHHKRGREASQKKGGQGQGGSGRIRFGGRAQAGGIDGRRVFH